MVGRATGWRTVQTLTRGYGKGSGRTRFSRNRRTDREDPVTRANGRAKGLVPRVTSDIVKPCSVFDEQDGCHE